MSTRLPAAENAISSQAGANVDYVRVANSSRTSRTTGVETLRSLNAVRRIR